MFSTVSMTFPQFTGLNRMPSSSPIQTRINPPELMLNHTRLRQDSISFGASVRQDYGAGSHAAGAGGDEPWRPPNFNPFGPPADAPVIPTQSELQDEAIKQQAREAAHAARAALLESKPDATSKELRRAYSKAYDKIYKTTNNRKDANRKYNHSEGGKDRNRKYNYTEGGKGRSTKYFQSEKGKNIVTKYKKSTQRKDAQRKYREADKQKAIELVEILDPASLPPDTLPALKAAPTLQQHLQSIDGISVSKRGLTHAIGEHRRKQKSQASDTRSTETSGSISQPFSNLQINPFSHPPRNQEEADRWIDYGKQMLAVGFNWESHQQASRSTTPPNGWSAHRYTFIQNGIPSDVIDFRHSDGTREAFEYPDLQQSLGDSQRKPNETHKKE